MIEIAATSTGFVGLCTEFGAAIQALFAADPLLASVAECFGLVVFPCMINGVG